MLFHSFHSRVWVARLGSLAGLPATPIRMASMQGEAEMRGTDAAGKHNFRILKEEEVHRRYLTLYNRSISFPAVGDKPAMTHEYDVVGHPQCDFHFTVVFPYHAPSEGQSEGHVTLLREYCQGVNEMMYVLPTGGFDPKRHTACLACAEAELSEEAHLRGGTWQRLLPEGHPGLVEIKWGANRFTPFLTINPQEDSKPGLRDAEEFIEVHKVSIRELRAIMVSGSMLLPSITTSFLALEQLQEQGLL